MRLECALAFMGSSCLKVACEELNVSLKSVQALAKRVDARQREHDHTQLSTSTPTSHAEALRLAREHLLASRRQERGARAAIQREIWDHTGFRVSYAAMERDTQHSSKEMPLSKSAKALKDITNESGPITLQQLAAKAHVSDRTVYRYRKVLGLRMDEESRGHQSRLDWARAVHVDYYMLHLLHVSNGSQMCITEEFVSEQRSCFSIRWEKNCISLRCRPARLL